MTGAFSGAILRGMDSAADIRLSKLLGAPPVPQFARTPAVAPIPEPPDTNGLRALAGKAIGKADTKGVDTFLAPRMPGRFAPSEIRKRGTEWRQDRYLKAYAATMGNHSIARFFAAWSPTEFRTEISNYPMFQQNIADEAEMIADRAKYVLYVDLGLIEGEVGKKTRTSVSAVLARLVEDLHARSEQPTPKIPYKRPPPRRVRVEGISRPGDSPPV